MPLPKSVSDKILWTEEHMEILRNARNGYFNDPSNKIWVNTEGYATAFMGPPVPWQFAHILGDCLQNLRASMDYLVRELYATARVNPPDQSSFPICTDADAFKKARRGRLKGLPAQMVAVIESLQPYQASQRIELTVLNEFANISKHRAILLTQLAVANIDPGLQTAPIAHAQAELSDVKVEENVVVFITINEPTFREDACSTMFDLIKYVKRTVMPAFEKFF